jgi:GntR family transcriptional regulator
MTQATILAAPQAPLADPLSGLRVDKSAAQPGWRQLHEQISALMAAGTLGAQAYLPSERDLALTLGVSRTIVKRCYDELRRAGRLAGHGREGSVVQAPPLRVQPALGRLKGFTEEMRELGIEPSTLLQAREEVRERVIASIFGRPSTAPFLRVVRIRCGDGTPMTREVAWYDLTLAPALAKWDGQSSAYQFLQHECALTLAWADQSVEAVLSTPEETQAFGFDAPQPCLLFKRKTWTGHEQLVEYVEGTFRGDAYVYRLRLQA